MDLSNFKVLSKEAYDALEGKEQWKYEMQLEAYNKAEQERVIIEAAEKIVSSQLAEKLKEAEKTNAEAIESFKAEQELKTEKLLAQLNKAKEAEVKTRMSSFSDLITEKLSTPEGEQMIKEFFKGRREGFKADFETDQVKAMSYTAFAVVPVFGGIAGPGHDDFHARNLIPVLPTETNLVTILQYIVDAGADGFGNVAAGGQKPSLGYIPALKEFPVRKIAGLLDVPDEQMDDVVGFRAWLAYELPKAYMDYEDTQIYKGDGTGENLLGLWTQASVQSFPMGTVNASSNTIDKILAGATEVRQKKRGTSAVVISPVDYMEILINKDSENAYTYPMVLGNDNILRIGGIAVFWSNVFESGEGLAGDFYRGATIYQRRSMTLGYFDQNKDNVEKNIVTVRLEGRIALAIRYPDSFLKLDLGANTPT